MIAVTTMETTIGLPADTPKRNLAKIAALVCSIITAGLLVASLISASSARAGGGVVTSAATSHR